MYLLYTLGFVLIGLGMLPALLWRSICGARYHCDLRERVGYGRLSQLGATKNCLWFHAASVGEVQGLQPIIARIAQQFSGQPIVCSTFTPTGKMMAQRILSESIAVFLLPCDLPWIMRRVIRRLRPRAIIVQETELWPHLFRAAAQQRVPVIIVNGRLSPRSFRRYAWFRGLLRRLLADVTLLLVQSDTAAQRFCALGALPERVHVVGNTNIDRVLSAAECVSKPHPLAGMLPAGPVLVAGSTHEGEETLVLSVYRRLRVLCPELRLVLAPRHVERAETVVRHIRAAQFGAVRRSQCTASPVTMLGDEDVLILDTLGELLTLYSLCTMAFVGGSLVPIGGHNMLEPAVFAKPVFFGPHMYHFPELAMMLCDASGAQQVQNVEDLYEGMARLLRDPGAGVRMGQRAREALVANRGALERTHRLVTAFLLAQPEYGKSVKAAH